MNFDKEDFIKSYQKYLINLVQDFLRDDLYKIVSSTYLIVTISEKQFDFLKKYFPDDNIHETYKKSKELGGLMADYSKFSSSIILNYYHNKLDLGTNSTLSSNYFKDDSINSNLNMRNVVGYNSHTNKELNQFLLNSCNNILLNDTLKTKDIYTLRNETIQIIISQSDLSWDKNDLFYTVTNKIQTIFSHTLRLFENENKNYEQLFDYIPFLKDDEFSKYHIFCEINFKKHFLPLIINLKITEAQSLFINLSKTYITENFELISDSVDNTFIEILEKKVPNILYQRHMKINIDNDDFMFDI